MNKQAFRNLALICFLICLTLALMICKPKSKGTFEPYVPDEQDPQTVMIGRPSEGN